MSIQYCRMAASRFGRQMTVGSGFFSRGNTSLSTRRYNAILVDAAPSTQLTRRSTNLGDLVSSIVLGAAPARTTTLATESTTTAVSAAPSNSILSWAIWLIKRTYQPSLLKKKRQCGYMKRKQSVGGRRILKRRKKKGRKRLFGA